MMSWFLLRLSAKESCKSLRKESPLYCSVLEKNVQITKDFYNHIYHSKKGRSKDEVFFRIMFIPFIKKVLKGGKIVEIRRFKTENFIQIQWDTKNLTLSAILSEKNKQLKLVSCFKPIKKKPVLTLKGTSPNKLDPGYFENNHITTKTKSQTLKTKFAQFLKKSNLKGKKILLMVSGGVDSRALLDIATRTLPSKQIAVFHLNHKTRPQSENDSNFVQKICSEKNIKFYGKTLAKIPTKNKEKHWRDTRKKLAKECQEDFGAKAILTAHHATDLVETMLFRLVKGCGPDGLSPFDINTKPFWNIPKSELTEYAKTNNLDWVEDETNKDCKIQRNLIRQKILPELRKITPNLEKVFINESVIFAETADFLSDSVDQYSVGANNYSPLQKSGQIKLSDFLDLSEILQREFLRKIAVKTPSFSEVEDCLRWLRGGAEGGSEKVMGGKNLIVQSNSVIWE